MLAIIIKFVRTHFVFGRSFKTKLCMSSVLIEGIEGFGELCVSGTLSITDVCWDVFTLSYTKEEKDLLCTQQTQPTKDLRHKLLYLFVYFNNTINGGIF